MADNEQSGVADGSCSAEAQWMESTKKHIAMHLLPLPVSQVPTTEEEDLTQSIHNSMLEHYILDELHRLKVVCLSEVRSEKFAKPECAPKGKAFQNSSHFLIAWFTSYSPQEKSKHYGSRLYLQDKTGCISCLVVNPSIKWLNNVVVVTSWNFIPGKNESEDFIEIVNPLIPRYRSGTVHLNFDVVNVRDAYHLLNQKDGYKIKSVNVQGLINAVSEPVCVKDKELFCIQMQLEDAKVNVVVMDPTFLHWRPFIHPKRDFVFLDMKPTTLNKGKPHEKKVFVPDTNSKFYEVKVDSSVNIQELDIQQWLSKYCAGVPLSSNPETCHLVDEEAEASKHFAVCSYQGIITNIDRSNYGIYELDGKVVLYLLSIPAVHMFAGLRVGTAIKVHNAHHRVQPSMDKPPTLILYCCYLGNVEITAFAPYDRSIGSRSELYHHQKSLYSHLVHYYSLSFTQLAQIMEAGEVLKSKLCPNYCSSGSSASKKTGLLHKLLIMENPAVCSPQLTKNPRNMLMEFTAEKHECSLASKKKLSPIVFPVIADIHVNHKMNSSTDVYTNEFWAYKVMASTESTPPWAIIGSLKTCKNSGRMTLVDQSGEIECRVMVDTCLTPEHGHRSKDDSSQSNQRNPSCGNTEHNLYDCAVVQTWSDGDLVRIDNYYIVLEKFQGTNNTDEVNSYIYIMFSREDVVTLRKNGTRYNFSKGKHKSSHLSSYPNKKKRKCASNTKQDAQIAGPSLRGKLDQPKSQCKESQVAHTNLSTCEELVTYRIFIENKTIMRCKKCMPKPRLEFFAMAKVFGGQIDNAKRLEAFGKDAKNVTNICFHFGVGVLHWYPIIHSNCWYKLVVRNEYENNSSLPLALHRVAVLQGSRSNISVSGDMDFEQISPPSESMNCEVKINPVNVISVQEAVNRCSPISLVSFEGTVISKSFVENNSKVSLGVENPPENSCFAALKNLDCKLTIKDYQLDAQTSVYIPLDDLPYPIGLIPGAQVKFGQFEQKISKKGRVYFHYLPSSSIEVIEFQKQHEEVLNETHGRNTEMGIKSALPHVHLAALHNTVFKDQFVIIAHIHQILYLDFKCVCSACGAIYRDRQCTNNACRCCLEPIMKSKASVLIDDGTGTTVAYCSGVVVQTLLTLSPSQWDKFENYITTHGETEYSQGKDQEWHTPEAKLLRQLCNSRVVKRAVRMVCRLPSTPQRQVDEYSLEDFSQKLVDGVDSFIETGVLPLTKLQCVAIETINFQEHCNFLMKPS